MTPPDSPSALLERAAAWLTELSTLTTPLPWGVGEELAGTLKVLGADAEWIATMSPAVAPPLVEWLREAVVLYRDELARGWMSADVLDRVWLTHPAVSFARAVLSESP